MSSPLQARFDLAVSAAREAGQGTLRYFRAPGLKVDVKSDRTPVTIADREAESLLRERIESAFGDDAILGEELGEKSGTSGYRWIVDPIDGTKSFIRGVPLYGTMVGVERDGRSVIGVVYIPALDECAFAAVGAGCWYERAGHRRELARVSTRSTLSEALVCASETRFPTVARADAYARIQNACLVSRTWGDCYGYLLVATGRAEVMIDPVMQVWDTAALQPILEEAGGTFTDWQGQPTIYGNEAVATNGRVLDEVLAIIRGA